MTNWEKLNNMAVGDGYYMKKKSLGNTGEMVSELCLGTMMIGTVVDKHDSYKVLDHFAGLGGNFIDTANCYSWWIGHGENIGDESENMLGDWMKERKNRDKMFIATKVGARLKDPFHIRNSNGEPDWDRAKNEYEGLSAGVIRKEVENSLKRLKTDYIDLYYTHVYDPNTPIEETLTVLHELVKEGKVRNIGASNLSTNQLAEANQISKQRSLTPYSVLQQEYSYIHPKSNADTGITNHADDEMFRYVNKEKMAFCAYSPLLKGIYGSRSKRLKYYNWNLFNSEQNIKKLDLVEKIAGQLNITGNQLVLAWLLHNKQSIFPLMGFSRIEQYFENIKVHDMEIPKDIMDSLNEL